MADTIQWIEMTSAFLLDEPSEQLYAEVIRYAAARDGRVRPGDGRHSDVSRFCEHLPFAPTWNQHGWLSFDPSKVEDVSAGLQAYVTNRTTPYPVAEVQTGDSKQIYTVDYEYFSATIEESALRALIGAGRLAEVPRTSAVDVLGEFERTEQFIDELLWPIEPEEFDERVAAEFAQLPTAPTDEDTGAMICNAALPLDLHGEVLGRMIRRRFTYPDPGDELEKIALWESCAHKWQTTAQEYLLKVQTDSLCRLEPATRRRLLDIAARCLELHS